MANSKYEKLFEPGNIVLILIGFIIIGAIIRGRTLLQVPRYYAIQVTGKDGHKKWIYLNADEEDTDKDKDLWEPPCIATEEEEATLLMGYYDESDITKKKLDGLNGLGDITLADLMKTPQVSDEEDMPIPNENRSPK